MKLFFGGSFDPVHLGHLLVARDVRESLGFESVVFVPACQAPLKKPHVASPQDRIEMLRLSVEGVEGFEVSDIEIRRGGISYTVDTASELKALTGERPFFLVGADSFLSLHLWKEPHKLVSLARFVIVDRENRWMHLRDYIRENFPQMKEGIDFQVVAVRRIDISSTEIRERLKEGKSIRWLVPQVVEDYIHLKRLYRT